MKEALDKDLDEYQTRDDIDHLLWEPVSVLVRTLGSPLTFRGWSLRLPGYAWPCQTDPSVTEQMLGLLWNELHQNESRRKYI